MSNAYCFNSGAAQSCNLREAQHYHMLQVERQKLNKEEQERFITQQFHVVIAHNQEAIYFILELE